MTELIELLERVTEVYRENGKTDFDAGRVQGIKEAIEALNE